MNKAKKILLGLSLIGAIGLAYSIFMLKDMPDIFDLELDDNE